MGRKYFENCSGLHSQHDVHFTELVASGCCCSRSSPFLFEQKKFMRGGRGTMGNDVEIRKSSRVTMQAFCECGFVQTYCNNRSLDLNIYTFKHGLKRFFIQIL